MQLHREKLWENLLDNMSRQHLDLAYSYGLPYLTASPFPSCLYFSSILNKLTPEKFDKLCLELLNVGVDSKLVLKGIILLVSVHFSPLVLC